MSTQARRRVIAFLIVFLTVAFLALVNQLSRPAPSHADPLPLSAPKVSIVFVIDSSNNMFPLFGPTYFDLARDGVVEFLDRLHVSADGRYEIAVIQYASLDAVGYVEDVHWIRPTQVTDSTILEGLRNAIADLEPTGHFSASLMEVGIREAARVLDPANNYSFGDGDTKRHIILLATGEYRLPRPCPPAGYTASDPENCEWCADCDTDVGLCYDGEYCNRACHIRHFAEQARAGGVRLSTLRLGPDWKNDGYRCPEAPSPYSDGYGSTPDYCPGYSANPPAQPDRDGFLKELANWDHDADGQVVACDAEQPLGKNARIPPFQCFDTGLADCSPGTPEDIADTITGWLCAWAVEGLSPEELADHDENPDDDFAQGDLTKPILSLCDNCPQTYNPHQRDCDSDGVGDVCQFASPDPLDCGTGTTDEDCDGIPLGADICHGGDDCLVRKWIADLKCEEDASLGDCGCDCDHDGTADPCQTAKEMRDVTLPDPDAQPPVTWADLDANYTGIADLCDNPLLCKPFPAICDPDPETGYSETFDSYPNGAGVAELPGWWIDNSSASDAVAVLSDGPPEAPTKFLQLGISEGTGILTTGETPWFVEGPGLILPRMTCSSTVCDTPAVARWGVYAIEVDMRISGATDGPTYDLYIMDPCTVDWKDAARIHLRFTDEGGVQTIWSENQGLCSGEISSDNLISLGAYEKGEWFRLTMIMNLAQHYTSDTCSWWGGGYPLRVYDDDANAITCNSFLEELGRLEPGLARGVQLLVTTNNKESGGTSPDLFQLRQIVVRETDQCEWLSGPFHTCDGRAYNSACCCSWTWAGTMWHCEWVHGTCGDDVLDGYEECEPPNSVHCDCECKWMCGDGYSQTQEAAYGPGLPLFPVVNGRYADEVCEFFGVLPGCRAGSEHCDPPGFHYWLPPCGHYYCDEWCWPQYRYPDYCCDEYWCECTDCVQPPACGDGCLCREHARPPYGDCTPEREQDGECQACDGGTLPNGNRCEECEPDQTGCNDECLVDDSDPG